MAPLPDTNTPRLFIDYTVGGQEHTQIIRLKTSGTTVDATTAYAVLAPLIAAGLHTSDSVTGARFAANGSPFSFSLPVAAETGDITSTPDPDKEPNFVSTVGRSADGRRVRVTFFSQYVDIVADGYRVLSPAGVFEAWKDGVQGATVDARTISGLAPIWQTYLNLGVNAYYQRKARRT